MDDAELDVLAYMTFPKMHTPKLHFTNLIERLNGEIKRCHRKARWCAAFGIERRMGRPARPI